jgi:hypothetical protein
MMSTVLFKPCFKSLSSIRAHCHGMRALLQGVIPHMAREYGFEYDLVTYKWPSWLHKQTEKQRIIWAYKILFLDVLFPLSLKKASSLLRAKASNILSRHQLT